MPTPKRRRPQDMTWQERALTAERLLRGVMEPCDNEGMLQGVRDRREARAYLDALAASGKKEPTTC